MFGGTGHIQPLIDALHSDGRLRVWSVVMTIFGDVVQLRGGEIAMSDLLALNQTLGISSGALRTAMSRLSKEGWVVSIRKGRTARYELSEQGAAETIPATGRIYAAPDDTEVTEWTVTIGEPDRATDRIDTARKLAAAGALMPRPTVALWPTPPAESLLTELSLLRLDGAALTVTPDWVRNAVCPPELGEAYDRLISLFEPLDRAVADGLDLEPAAALTARILLIHSWRRIVLRQPPVPAALHPHGWPAPRAHEMVARLYHRLVPLSETWWDAPLTSEGALKLSRRFR